MKNIKGMSQSDHVPTDIKEAAAMERLRMELSERERGVYTHTWSRKQPPIF